MNIKDFFLEDWRNIPQNYRYFFLAGVYLDRTYVAKRPLGKFCGKLCKSAGT